MGWVIFVSLQQHLSQVQLKVIGVAAMATPMSGGTVPLEPGEDHMVFAGAKVSCKRNGMEPSLNPGISSFMKGSVPAEPVQPGQGSS